METLERPKPQNVKQEILEEISNGTDEGVQNAVQIALLDGKTYTEEQIVEMCDKITIVSGIELNRRKGLMVVSDNFDWFTEWSVELKKMQCPSCGVVWELGKEKSKNCPSCGVDIIKLTKKFLEKNND